MWSWGLGLDTCSILVQNGAFRFGPAWSPPWVGACERVIRREVEKGFALLEPEFFAYAAEGCAGSRCVMVESSLLRREFVGASLGVTNSTDGTLHVLLNPVRQCFRESHQSEICFDDDYEMFKTVRRGLLVLSVALLALAGYWQLVVSSTGKKVNPLSYGELAQEIWRLKKQKCEKEEQERVAGARIERIAQKRDDIEKELVRRRGAVVGQSAAHDEDDATIAADASNLVRASLQDEVDALNERLTDDEAHLLELRLQSIKLEGSIEVASAGLKRLVKTNVRARFFISLAVAVWLTHGFYVKFLCPNRSDSSCLSLAEQVAEQVAVLIDSPARAPFSSSAAQAIPPLSSLSQGKLQALARKELQPEALERCSRQLAGCIDEQRASRAAILARSFHAAECGVFLFPHLFVAANPLTYFQGLQRATSWVVRALVGFSLYSIEHKQLERTYCMTWEGVVRGLVEAPSRLSLADAQALQGYSSISKKYRAAMSAYRPQGLILSVVHQTLSGNDDRNADGIEDTPDVDKDGVPDELQSAIDAFIRSRRE